MRGITNRTVGLLGTATVLAVLSGCVQTPVLTAEAQNLRMIIKAEPDQACQEIGDVSTDNDWFRDEGAVKVVLRNKAAARGANLVTLDVLKTSGNLVGGSGRAFKCP